MIEELTLATDAEDNDCYLPGWGDGPDDEQCELVGDHDGQHAAFALEPNPVRWDVTWVMDEEDFPFGD